VANPCTRLLGKSSRRRQGNLAFRLTNQRNRCEARKEDEAEPVAAKPNHDADLAAWPLQTPKARGRHLEAGVLVRCLANWPQMPWFSAYVPVRSWCPSALGSAAAEREKQLLRRRKQIYCEKLKLCVVWVQWHEQWCKQDVHSLAC